MSFKAHLRGAVAPLALVALLSATGIAAAQDQAPPPNPATLVPAKPGNKPDTVIATVNGTTITEADLGFVAEDFATELARVPDSEKRRILMDVLVDMTLVSQAAEKAGIQDKPDFKERMDYLRLRTLRNTYITDDVQPQVTDADLKARYESEIKKFQGPEEVHAKHILVAKKEEAEAIIKELQNGGDFDKIAKEKSIDTGSGAQGGDLGYFTHGQMVKPFEDAAFALEVGQITKEPIQTEFGWHVIKLEDKRKQAPRASTR
ncbi:peptidylprolyl isomerase [Segnochrobactrum spirostomi]|nr:peptidylprolyl isomerase [Segnochrobactrum spirostomi]